jgi:hypothetical protein
VRPDNDFLRPDNIAIVPRPLPNNKIHQHTPRRRSIYQVTPDTLYHAPEFSEHKNTRHNTPQPHPVYQT